MTKLVGLFIHPLVGKKNADSVSRPSRRGRLEGGSCRLCNFHFLGLADAGLVALAAWAGQFAATLAASWDAMGHGQSQFRVMGNNQLTSSPEEKITNKNSWNTMEDFNQLVELRGSSLIQHFKDQP